MGGSADDGKRFVEVPSGTSCAERFMWEERDDIEKNRGGVRGGDGLGIAPPFDPRRIYKIFVFPFVFQGFLLPRGIQDGIDFLSIF